MGHTVDLGMAKLLAGSQVIRGAEVQSLLNGGWVVRLTIGVEERDLRTKRGEIRVFSTLDAAFQVLVRDLKVRRFWVVAEPK